MLSINQKAPDFTLSDQNGEEHSLLQHRGSWVLVYFYPKDDTPGCTKEACTIRDLYDDFEKAGIVVIGISSDSAGSHKKFAEKYELPFTLLADTEKEVIKKYETGGMFMTKRISYLINPEGKIGFVYPKVTPADHAHQILENLKMLMV